jgi:hypothetical protein
MKTKNEDKHQLNDVRPIDFWPNDVKMTKALKMIPLWVI